MGPRLGLVTVEEVRVPATGLPRSYEVPVRDRVKFCVGRIVSDLRYHGVVVRLAAIDQDEMTELVLDAWRMVVPKRVAAEVLSDLP